MVIICYEMEVNIIHEFTQRDKQEIVIFKSVFRSTFEAGV